MNIAFNDGEQITLPRLAATCGDAERIDYAVLLAAAAYPELSDVSALAEKLGESPKKVRAALEFWIENGVLLAENAADSAAESAADQPEKEKKPLLPETAPPVYSAEQLAEMLENEENPLRGLIDECQRLAGKLFNPTEIGKLAALTDYLRMEREQVLLIFSYCASIGKPSVHYVEKTAYNLYDEGIDTVEKTENYLADLERKRSAGDRAARLFGLGQRRLTAKEKEAFDRWINLWGFSEPMLTLAYDAATEKTGRFSLAYMDKIVTRWHEENVTTVEQVHSEAETRKLTAQSAAQGAAGSFDTDDFIDAALKKSYAQLEKHKKQN